MLRNSISTLRTSSSVLLLSAWALTSCVPSPSGEDGQASAVLAFSDGTSIEVSYEPLLGQLRLSPPVEQEIEVIFNYDDPFVELRIRVDAANVHAGEVLSLPVASESLTLQVAVENATYTSEHALSSGTLTFQVLYVDGDYAEIDVNYDVTLGEQGGEDTLRATGRVASTYGVRAVSADADVPDRADD